MVDQEHFHLESLEAFTGELEAAGFRMVADSDRSRWRGKIHPAFESLTDAQTMDIAIAPGWPFQPPLLLVQGLNTNHSTLGGLVCMWQDGDFSHEWTTLAGLFARIEEWCSNAKQGWQGDHLERDAFLNFKNKDPLVAIFDLAELGVRRHSWGEFRGVVNPDPVRLGLKPGRQSSGSELRGLWFHAGELETPPPRQLSELPVCLTRNQRRGLLKAVGERRRPAPLAASGGVDLILFCWVRHAQTDLLVMACKGTRDEVEAIALQAGLNDEQSLMLRAGPDAATLHSRGAALFGVGGSGRAHGDATRDQRHRLLGDSRSRRAVTGQRGETCRRERPRRRCQSSGRGERDWRARPVDQGHRIPGVITDTGADTRTHSGY